MNIEKFWRQLKIRRRLPLGPICLEFSFLKRTKLRSENYYKSDNDLEFTNQTNNIVHSKIAVIVGVGPGFGYALAYRLAQESFQIILISRNINKLDSLMTDITQQGKSVSAYACDVTMELSVNALFKKIVEYHGTPDLVVYGLQSFGPGHSINIEVPAFENSWRHNCLGAFLVSRVAAKAMLPQARGTIILVGSTSSIIGRSAHLNLAVGKFGQRALAQVLSRELWPKGIHVCHVMIDADIREEADENSDSPYADANDIVESIVFLHQQPKTAWTSELDLRPWNEEFWEHC